MDFNVELFFLDSGQELMQYHLATPCWKCRVRRWHESVQQKKNASKVQYFMLYTFNGSVHEIKKCSTLFILKENKMVAILTPAVCPLQWPELTLTSYSFLKSLSVLGKSPKSFSFLGSA